MVIGLSVPGLPLGVRGWQAIRCNGAKLRPIHTRMSVVKSCPPPSRVQYIRAAATGYRGEYRHASVRCGDNPVGGVGSRFHLDDLLLTLRYLSLMGFRARGRRLSRPIHSTEKLEWKASKFPKLIISTSTC